MRFLRDCSAQTDEQTETYRHADHNTLTHTGGQVLNIIDSKPQSKHIDVTHILLQPVN